MGWTRQTVLEVAKRTGYPVVEAWSSHDYGQMGTVVGPLLHHTATSDTATGDYPSLKIVRDGRAGLENSLCMYGLGRSGTIYCVSEKISWHAGVGSWNGVTDGNGHFAGIEAESSGDGTDWTSAQIDAYEKLVASILLEANRGTDWMPEHKQFALPAGRKVDPAGIDLNDFKSNVQKYLDNPALLDEGDDDMATPAENADATWGKKINNGANAAARLVAIQTNAEMAVRRLDKLLATQLDPQTVAAELVKLLPSGTAPTQDQVTEALRTLLGIPDSQE